MTSSDILKHKRSGLLSVDDNELVFKLVGQNCQTLSTTVIELHRNLSLKGECDWSKEEVGVLCLVRDLIKKCHFFRIFCLIRKRKVWEYVIHDRMQYSTPDPFLHFFKVEESTYAFYFVSEQEAGEMHEILVQLLDNYDRKPNVTENDKVHEINPATGGPSRFTLKLNGNGSNRENAGRRLINFGKQFCRFKMFSRKDDEDKKKKPSKNDISPPHDFKYVSHICDFKERMNQIKADDMWNDKMSLKCPSSTPTSIIPSIRPPSPARAVGPDIAPPLPEKKSPRFAHRVLSTKAANYDKNNSFLHAAKPSDSSVLDIAPPLPEKKSRSDRRYPMQYQFTASVKPASSEKETSRKTPQSPTYRSRGENDIPSNKFNSTLVPSFSSANAAHHFGNDTMQWPTHGLKNASRSTCEQPRFKFPGDDKFQGNGFAPPEVATYSEKKSRLDRQYSISKPCWDDSGHYNIIDAVRRSVMNPSTSESIPSPTYLRSPTYFPSPSYLSNSTYPSSSEKTTHLSHPLNFPNVSHPTKKIHQNVNNSIPPPHIFLVESTLLKKSTPCSQIVAAEMKPSARSIDSSADVESASTYEPLPPPRPLTKYKSPQSEPATYGDTNTTQCHYDVITGPPHPIIPPPPTVDVSSYDQTGRNSPYAVDKQTSSNLVSQANAASNNVWSQAFPGESIRRAEPKPCTINPANAHQYLPETCSSPSSRYCVRPSLPVSLITDINRGVKLKHVERK